MAGDDMSTARRMVAAQGLNVCRAGFAGRGTPSALSTGRHSRDPSPTRDSVSGRASHPGFTTRKSICPARASSSAWSAAGLRRRSQRPARRARGWT